MDKKNYILGLDIGGTKLAVVVSDKNGKIIQKVRKATESKKGPDYAIGKLIDMVNEAISLADIEWTDIIGIGASCGGPLDTKTGIIYSPPNLPGWDAIPFKEIFESEFKLPVIVENDANASALAEWMFGAGKGYDYVLYMTMGTGIGGGIIAEGNIYHGANDSAGEVGHQVLLPDGPLCGCGQRGCLEALCSGPAIARRAQEAVKKNPDTKILLLADGDIDKVKSELVVQAAKNNDKLALKLIDETAYYMGWGIANLVNIINPEVIVLGTIAVASGDLLLNPIRKYVNKFAMERPAKIVKIVPAQLGDYVGDIAAVALVIQHFAKS